MQQSRTLQTGLSSCLSASWVKSSTLQIPPAAVAHVQRTEPKTGEGCFYLNICHVSFDSRKSSRPHSTPTNKSSTCRHNTAWTRAQRENKFLPDTAAACLVQIVCFFPEYILDNSAVKRIFVFITIPCLLINAINILLRYNLKM